MGRATLEASLGGGILATQASACLYIDILVLLGPFLCAVWLLDEWVSSTPHPFKPSPFGGLYYYSLALTGKSEKVTLQNTSTQPILALVLYWTQG